MVKADTSRRVYSYEADFSVTTNGRYEFLVVGSITTETFCLDVNNIDNEKPAIEIVGSDELTILEDTPYVDMGFGGQYLPAHPSYTCSKQTPQACHQSRHKEWLHSQYVRKYRLSR